MLQFVLGGAGVGKSQYLYQNIAQDLSQNRKVLLIVPEHQVLESEKALISTCDGIPTLQLEVLSFSRLAQRVFRTLGGMTERDIDRGAQLLVLWRALRELAPFMQEFCNVTLREQGFLERTLDTISEFQNNCITSTQLQEILPKIASEALRAKMSDFAQIYTAFEAILAQEYDYTGNALARATELLCDNAVFGDFCIYIDSFVGFTAQEYQLMKELMRFATKTIVALPYLEKEAFFLQEAVLTKSNIEKIAKKIGVAITDPIVLSSDSGKNPAIQYLSQNLWEIDQQAVSFDKAQLPQLYTSAGIFEELELVAQKICQEVRNGRSYREIAIISRNLNRYEGILESVFHAYDIPFFLSKRIELQKKPFIRWSQNLLTVLANHFRLQDVLSYLRTPYLSISADEYDLFERYVTLWNIEGDKWLDDAPWTMNPDGYTDLETKETKEKLNRINAIRVRITAPFRTLYRIFCAKCNVKDACSALYQAALSLEIPKQLQEENANESNLIWNTWIDALDQLCRACGVEEVQNPRQFLQMLNLILSQAFLRDIPSYADAVLIADAAEIQASDIKSVYLIGVVSEQFPSVSNTSSLFSAWERKDLLASGLNLTQVDDLSVARELYYAYRAVSFAKEKLTLTCYTCGGAVPSELFDRVAQIFSCEPQEISLDAQIQKKDPAWQFYCTHRDTMQGKALEKLFEQDNAYETRFKQLRQVTFGDALHLLPETAKELYPADLALTQGRLEQFVKCPFAFHCQYTLGLSPMPNNRFRAADSGTLIHRVLERVLDQIQQKPTGFAEIEDAEIADMVKTEINRYLIACCGNQESASVRLQNLFRRLQRNAILLVQNLVQEFKQSSFYPAFFELPMGTKESENGAKTLEIPLTDGTKAQIYGIIDRVDLYEQDNEVYIRVVDYKTGVTEHRLEDVQYGINLQMFIYLFALWKNPPKVLQNRVKATENTAFLPAGVLYFSAKPPSIRSNVGFLSPEVYQEAMLIPRTGLLLDDDRVLEAMEHGLQNKFIPLGDGKKGIHLHNLEEFGALYRQICDVVSNIATEMKNGVADATPNFHKNNCDYCSYQDICRKAKKSKKR